MSEYITNVDSKVLATVQLELKKKERQQQRRYAFLQELQSMARELPSKYQQRLPYDLLCNLANALLDGTVFEIVNSLREVQQMEEYNLFNQRRHLEKELAQEKRFLLESHKERLMKCQAMPHNLPLETQKIQEELKDFEERKKKDLNRCDMKIITALDQKVMDQQSTLEKAGVVGFSVTNNSSEIRLQMYLLDFITRLCHFETASHF